MEKTATTIDTPKQFVQKVLDYQYDELFENCVETCQYTYTDKYVGDCEIFCEEGFSQVLD